MTSRVFESLTPHSIISGEGVVPVERLPGSLSKRGVAQQHAYVCFGFRGAGFDAKRLSLKVISRLMKDRRI